MRKINTLVLVGIIICLIHNSFLFRISVSLSNSPSLIPYGGFFILSYMYIFLLNYRKNNIDYRKLKISLIALVMLLFIGVSKELVYENYSIFDNLIFRFVFLYFIILIYPVKKLNIEKNLLVKSLKGYLILNLLLGILQATLDKTILLTEYKGQPFINTIFYNSEYSTKYSYILNYGGEVRAFGFFDSGLSFGIFMIFLFLIIFFEKYKNNYIKVSVLLLVTWGIYLSHTKNVYIIFGITIIILCVQYFFKETKNKHLFYIQLGILILATIFIDAFMYLGSLLSKIGINISTFQSRGKLSREAIDLLNNPFKVLTGAPVDNGVIIDNELLYLLIQGGILLVAICLIIVYMAFRNSDTQSIGSDKLKLNRFHKTITVFILTYFIGGTANYLFGTYSVIIFIYLCYLKGEFNPRVLLYSLYPENFDNLKNYYDDNGLEENMSLVVYKHGTKKIEKLKKIWIKLFKPYDVVVSDYPTRLLQTANYLSISMGHGTAMKKFPSNKEIHDPNNFKLLSSIKLSDYYIVTSDHQNNLEMRAPELDKINRSEYLSLGLPKNDGLFKMRNTLEKKDKKKIILYAPTFRDYEEDTLQVSFIIKLNEFLRKNDLLLIYQPHPFKANMDLSTVSEKDKDRIQESKDLNLSEDELLSHADLLISDYSSIALKYLILEKPIEFFLYDYTRYVDERGIDFDFTNQDSSPGNVSKTPEDLFVHLDLFLKGEYENDSWICRRKACLKYHYKYPDEYSSERIWSLIENSFKGVHYEEKTNFVSNKK